MPATASCAYAADDPRVAALAEVIFSGTVAEDRQPWLGGTRTYVVVVDAVYRGEVRTEQRVTTLARSSVELEMGVRQRYLIFGRYGSAGSVESDNCTGSRPLTTGSATGYGQARPPVPGASGGRVGPSGLGAVAVLAAATAGLVLWVRRSGARSRP